MAKKKLTIEDVLVPKEEIPYEVPENWCWVKLGSVAQWSSGGTPSTKVAEYYDGNIPWVVIGDLNDGEVYTAKRNITELGLTKSSAKWVDIDSVLIAMYGASIGKMGINKIRCTTNQAIAFTKEIYNVTTYKYIYYYLLNIRERLISLGKGGAQPNISQTVIKEEPITLPPLAEQVRIANRIESLFDKVDKVAGLVDEAKEGFEKRRAAILERAFSGELTKKWRKENGISDEWEVIKFKELGKLERGRSKHRPRNDERLFGGKYPFIQTGDIANSNGYIYHHKQTLSDFGLEQSRLFPTGTLCITIAANIGDVAILTYDCCFPDSVVGFTPNNNIESKFIYYYLNLIKRDLENYAPATAQKNINLAILGALDIPKPSTDEQRQIVKILDKSLNNESKVEELIDLDDNIDLIKKAILAKAFRGELGSNDLNEESILEFLKHLFN